VQHVSWGHGPLSLLLLCGGVVLLWVGLWVVLLLLCKRVRVTLL